jgi:ferredoxin
VALWLKLNATFSLQWPGIACKGKSLPDADQHKNETGKFDKYFSSAAGTGAG